MKYLFFFSLFVSHLTVFSQIVNIENKRLTDNKQGFSGSAELNFNFTMNTVQLLQIGDKVQLGYVKKKHQFLIVTDHSFVKSEGDNFVNKGFQHFRYNYVFKDSGNVSFEAFQQGQFNKIQKINLRLLAGVGLRLNLVNEEKYQLSIGSGMMGEYEELLDVGSSTDVLSTSYLSFDGQFNETVGINTIAYYQPKLIDYGNYRFSSETALRFKINEYLSFLLIYSLTHDSRNIADVRKTNYVLKNTLRVSF
ncbi:hypothetical protein DNU06_06865 [Putridiphycobacter roseus]|uniref:DUF481 domain-containing protein n=1 Tax=Putridiphycobacter roseus TaxID=2219161 RepID=A0A2W1NEM3_9FLAO|nr:DUF481 domain-containing protein [Putridiphycobacter roseus]PZE17543.1 hypothetical protein DNU06_06865 [Putridiphycobacter roseus]